MAEAIAQSRFGDRIEAFSAGSEPKGRPTPQALETLRQHGLPTKPWRSKSWEEFRDQPIDLVITLCDSAARESCPTFPGAPVKAHWGFPDPPAAVDTGAAFEAVFDGLNAALERFIEHKDPDLGRRADDIARFVARLPVQTLDADR